MNSIWKRTKLYKLSSEVSDRLVKQHIYDLLNDLLTMRSKDKYKIEFGALAINIYKTTLGSENVQDFDHFQQHNIYASNNKTRCGEDAKDGHSLVVRWHVAMLSKCCSRCCVIHFYALLEDRIQLLVRDIIIFLLRS